MYLALLVDTWRFVSTHRWHFGFPLASKSSQPTGQYDAMWWEKGVDVKENFRPKNFLLPCTTTEWTIFNVTRRVAAAHINHQDTSLAWVKNLQVVNKKLRPPGSLMTPVLHNLLLFVTIKAPQEYHQWYQRWHLLQRLGLLHRVKSGRLIPSSSQQLMLLSPTADTLTCNLPKW